MSQSTNNLNNNTNDSSNQAETPAATKVSTDLQTNKKYLENMFSNCIDVVIRELYVSSNPQYPAFIIYVANMTPSNMVEDHILKKLISYPIGGTLNLDDIKYYENFLGVDETDIYDDMNVVIDGILQGNIALFVQNIDKAITASLKKPPGRSVEKPEEELSLRGSKEAFTESVSINMTLVRKRLKDKDLKMEPLKLGTRTRTDIVLSYINNLVNDKILEEIRTRLTEINTDSILDANYIQEYIGDGRKSIFPTAFVTEKPDTVISKLLEGRVAILVDGTPSVMTVPVVFMEFLQVSEDYYLRYIPTTFNRWIRYILFFVSLMLPGFYLAITTFHQELIPTSLLITIIQTRTNVPFPALFETLSMVFVFDALREAGLRMPRALGQAISIVGALVLGEAAVGAGLVSELMVIVVAFTGISSFTLAYPEMYLSMMIPRYIFLILGGTLGLLGLNCGLMILFINLMSKRSFGVPYMAPLMPLLPNELDDALIRFPIPNMENRPKLFTWRNSIRRKKNEENNK